MLPSINSIIPTVKFHRDYLEDELNLPDAAIVDKVIKTSRWSIISEIVFADKGKFYSTTYSVGATEMQDESPWEYEEEVECTEVHLVEKLVKVWEVV